MTKEIDDVLRDIQKTRDAVDRHATHFSGLDYTLNKMLLRSIDALFYISVASSEETILKTAREALLELKEMADRAKLKS